MKKTLYFHLGLAAACIVLAIGAYAMFYMHVAKLQAESVVLGEKVVRQSEEVLRLAENKNTLTAFTKEEEIVLTRFVHLDEVVDYIEAIEALAVKEQVSLNVSSVDVSKTEDPQLVIAFALEGEFAALVQMLASLEYGAYDSRIMTVTIGKGSAGKWSAVGSLETSVRK
jgi:hypothetical protein